MISEVTRRNIIDFLVRERVRWHGRLDEIAFLSRIYQLEKLSSTDQRKEFANAKDDIWQHRVRNYDWEDDWIFDDDRFGLLKGEDTIFLRFLVEMLHPVVRSDPIEVNILFNVLNAHLRVDGFELVQKGEVSGRPVFVALSINAGSPSVEQSGFSPEVGGERGSGATGSLFLTPQEVAALLRIDLTTVDSFLAAGDLRSMRLGKECRILADDVFNFLGEAVRRQQTELLKDSLSDPKIWARMIVKDPVKRKEIEDSHYAGGSFGAFLKSGLMALKSEEVGGRKEQLEDGTNVAVGTQFLEEPARTMLPFCLPSQAKHIRNWKENLAKLRDRFDRLIDEFCVSECFLIQTLIPAYNIQSRNPPGILPDRKRIRAGPGLTLEPAKLFIPGKSPVGLFPMMNVRGEPMLGTDGQPVAFRLGLSRYLSVYAIPDGQRPLPVPLLMELIGDGTNLLYQLPAEIAVCVWRNWQLGYSQRLSDTETLWLEALFEMSWRRRRGSPFHSERYAWHENGSVALSGTGLFPRLPHFITSTPGEFAPHEHGYPRAFYSKISDVARASVAAIDEILECEATADVACTNKANSKSAPTVVLLTVNEHETNAVLDAFMGVGRMPAHTTRAGITYNELGNHGGMRIVHTICEMGAGGIGAVQQRTRAAIDAWKPAAVIAVGIAFGMDESKQKIGDVLVAAQLQDYELGRLGNNGTISPRGDKPGTSDPLRNRLRQAYANQRRATADWPKVHFGLVLSGQKLVDNLDYREALKALYSGAIGGEMEGVGLYVSASEAKVDWIVIKGICDWGHNKNNPDKENWQKLVAQNAARVLKSALDLGNLYSKEFN